jgi:hypothetical protein
MKFTDFRRILFSMSLVIPLTGCERDRQHPEVTEIRINGISGDHLHTASGMESAIRAEVQDDEALRRIKATVLPGLHHGVSPETEPFFAPVTVSGVSWSSTAEVYGVSDSHEFRPVFPVGASGPHTLMISVLDEAGNMSDSFLHLELTSDALPSLLIYPAIPFEHTGSVLLAEPGGTLYLTGNVIDLIGLARIRTELRNRNGLLLWQSEEIIEGLNVVSMDGRFVELPAAAGDYAIIIRATGVTGLDNEVRANVRVVE